MNMNTNQKKQQQLNKGMAIAVAILLALTLIVTIIAFSAGKRSTGTTTASTTKQTLKSTSVTNNTTAATNAPNTDGTNGAGTTPDTSGENNGGDAPTGATEPDFVCPVSGSLVKDYSSDIPVFSLTMEDYRVHCGLDIGADAGTDVLAAASGEITKVFYDPMMGQTVEITHAGGYVTIYKNLQTKLPEGTVVGANVTAGDTIGYVGDTALVEISEEPHVHFEMQKDGENMNPLSKITLPEIDDSTNYED